MNNIEEMAVQTFSIVPEAYQQVFVENGVNFPDELVAAIKKDPTQASQILENDKQLKSEVVQIFKANKDAILKAAQNNTPSMKNGGKILGVMKFQFGGKYSVKNGDYSASVSALGDTLRTKVYPYTTREMQTYPNGNVRYTIFRKSDTQNFWSPQSKPNFLQKLWYGNRTVPADEAQNWEQIIKNHPEDPRNVRKHQDGGENVFSRTASQWGSIPTNEITGALPKPNTPKPNTPVNNLNNTAVNRQYFGNDKINSFMKRNEAAVNTLNNIKSTTDKLNKVGYVNNGLTSIG